MGDGGGDASPKGLKKNDGSEGAYNAGDAEGCHLHMWHHCKPLDFPPLLPACA